MPAGAWGFSDGEALCIGTCAADRTMIALQPGQMYADNFGYIARVTDVGPRGVTATCVGLTHSGGCNAADASAYTELLNIRGMRQSARVFRTTFCSPV